MAVLLLGSLMFLISAVTAQTIDADFEPEATLVVPDVPERFADLFESREFRYSGGVYENHPFDYRLFIPAIEPPRDYPILIWLHGNGEAGVDNLRHLAWLDQRVMTPPWNRDRFPFFMLCVQCPADNDFWNSAPPDTPPDKRLGSDMISVTDTILDTLIDEFPIDSRRIYLAGISSGGSGAWQYALRHPRKFAAVAPLAGSRVAGNFAELADVPVWCFHSTHDQGTSVAGARQNVAALQSAGGHAKLTEIDTVSHDCWTAAFGEHDLLAWMLAQRRGGPVVMEIRPWSRRFSDAIGDWTVGQAIGQVVVLALVGFGLIESLKWVRRKRMSHGGNPS